MNKKLFLLSSIIVLGFLSCEDVEVLDETNPSVVITYPFSLSVVSEIVNITCAAADNDSLKKVVLWIDGAETEIVDSIAPYVLSWNTLSYPDSSSHSITVTAHDMSGNIALSSPIQVIIDNRIAFPSPVNISSISYTDSEMLITINQSNDNDFKGYIYFYSEIENGEKYLLSDTSFVQKDTILKLTNFDPSISRWYWVKVIDIYDLSTLGEGFNVLDAKPESVILHPIFYNDNAFTISWNSSNESDFSLYSIFVSEYSDMRDSVLIYDSIERSDTSFTLNDIEKNQYKYYQIIVEDYWELSSSSNIQIGNSWTRFLKSFGDQNFDYGRSILQTENEDYLILGYNSALGNSANNISLIRTDSDGNMIWEQDINLSQTDKAYDFIITTDGNYLIVGQSTSSINGSSDILLLKTNSFGTVEWELHYGDDQDNIGQSVYQTYDGGFIVCGFTVSPNTGYNYVYLLKINSEGVEEWSKSYGGEGHDYGYSVLQDTDGGYIIAGVSRSSGDSNGDGFLMKTDSDGNQLWSKTYGGPLAEVIYDVDFTSDGGFILAGHTNSYGNGANDAFLIKVNSGGVEEWSQTFGSAGTDYARSGTQTNEGGYFITGYSDSFGSGTFDPWWIKVDQDGNYEKDQVYITNGDGRVFSGVQTLDGGYAMAGYVIPETQSNPDILLIKVDNQGRLLD